MANNKKTPAIRFKGFNDDWEQCKLGEVAQITMGQSPNSENYTDNPNDHILVQGNADMKNGRVSPRVWTTQVTKQAEKNDLILSVRAPVGDVGKTDYDVVLGRGVAGIKGNEFIFQLLTRMKENGYWRNLSTGSTFESINSNDIKEAYVLIPNNEEQVKIGLFFSNLDYLITLHQRKCDKLIIFKKAMLEKMFPKNGENLPEVRFEGFNDAWEQRKVAYLIKDIFEKTTTQNQYPVLTSSQQQGIVFQEDYFADRQVTTNDNVGYYVLPRGYFTYRSRSDTDLFVFNRNNLIDKGIISYYYPVFKSNKTDSNFLLRRLNHGIKKQLSMAAEGTGQKVLAHSKFKDMVVDVPTYNEQVKIGLLFETLDKLITLHQRKVEKLEIVKKSMLEKMFI
ncbi:restriction endonuclease subunit S [Clostridium cochlearium]|uniref:restriction endonuclease subunit S n=1 Tax=Clostridium cochlearium TaxID=1494 RepID=UPI00214A2CCB|nr:restriction endonuclease subunit S [Clostridium cochlearium]MCR1971501.1 restriction endonuclease subunit S [Clostridium cochlearium]